MTLITRRLTLALLCFLAGSGCGAEKHKYDAKATFPVKGKVLVDGQPASLVTVTCVPVKPADQSIPNATGLTDKDGKFALGTYKAGDGVPEGDYVLTFTWAALSTFKHTSAAANEGDKLNGRYTDAKTSETKFTVKKGPPTDLGEIKLTTNPQ